MACSTHANCDLQCCAVRARHASRIVALDATRIVCMMVVLPRQEHKTARTSRTSQCLSHPCHTKCYNTAKFSQVMSNKSRLGAVGCTTS